MIQRIQTIFLLLGIIALGLFNIYPYWVTTATDNQESFQLMSYGFVTIESGRAETIYGLYTVVAGIAIMALLVMLIEVLSYKNRILQMKLAIANSFIMSLDLVLMTYLIVSLQDEYQGSFGLGLFIFALAMLFNITSRRFIQRDEKLVRSVDRLR